MLSIIIAPRRKSFILGIFTFVLAVTLLFPSVATTAERCRCWKGPDNIVILDVTGWPEFSNRSACVSKTIQLMDDRSAMWGNDAINFNSGTTVELNLCEWKLAFDEVYCGDKICKKTNETCDTDSDCDIYGGGPEIGNAICRQKNREKKCYLDPVRMKRYEQSDTLLGMELDVQIKKPLLEINLPTLDFSVVSSNLKEESDGNIYLYLPWIGEYLAALYKYGMVVVSILGVVMIIVQGARVIASAGGEEKGKAYKRIVQIIIGLFIAWGSYVILYQINPALVEFKALRVMYMKTEEIPAPDDAANDTLIAENITISGATACDTLSSCKDLCSKDKTQWPDTTTIMIPPTETQVIPDYLIGIKGNGNKVKTPLIDALRKVGTAARSRGYDGINIGSGYRPLKNQIQLVCDKINTGAVSELGKKVAWPGGSQHGKGVAVDVKLLKNGKVIGKAGMNPQNINELEEIMRAGGFVRYCREWWHFELGTQGSASRPADLNSFCPRPYSGF